MWTVGQPANAAMKRRMLRASWRKSVSLRRLAQTSSTIRSGSNRPSRGSTPTTSRTAPDRAPAAVVEDRLVDLGDRRGGERRGLELGEDLVDRPAEGPLDLRDRELSREGPDPVL